MKSTKEKATQLKGVQKLKQLELRPLGEKAGLNPRGVHANQVQHLDKRPALVTEEEYANPDVQAKDREAIKSQSRPDPSLQSDAWSSANSAGEAPHSALGCSPPGRKARGNSEECWPKL